MMMEGEKMKAEIENLRAAALANLAKAGATQQTAQTDQYLSILSALDNIVTWHQNSQQMMVDHSNTQQQMAIDHAANQMQAQQSEAA